MDEELVTLATYRFVSEAEAVKVHLTEAGVFVFLADVETVSMDWLLGNAIGNVKLQVPASQLEAAAKVLEALSARRKDREETEWYLEEDEDAPLSCLSCGKPMDEDATKCPQCGWSYAPGEE